MKKNSSWIGVKGSAHQVFILPFIPVKKSDHLRNDRLDRTPGRDFQMSGMLQLHPAKRHLRCIFSYLEHRGTEFAPTPPSRKVELRAIEGGSDGP